MNGPVLIIGSAPISQQLSGQKLARFQKVAINKSWRLRDDFEHHVFLRSLDDEDRPPKSLKLNSVGQPAFKGPINSAGGLYVCSGSVAIIAGYWALPTLAPKVVAYYGCDLVFTPDPEGNTHFYGDGDTGPLVGNFNYNLRQEERSIRLLCWGLFHNAIFVNCSAEEGTKLAFPKRSFSGTGNALMAQVRGSKAGQELMRAAGEVFAFEAAVRTPEFDRKQSVFEKDAKAQQAMSDILDKWMGLAPQVAEFCKDVEQYP